MDIRKISVMKANMFVFIFKLYDKKASKIDRIPKAKVLI
jgi:hypothetical protein